MPEKLGRYEIREQIGSGGMGVVYKAWDARLNRFVAVKTMWPQLGSDREAQVRMLREARAAAALSHPNVTQIYDIGEDNGAVYLAMELVEGTSLEQMIRARGKFSTEDAIALIRQAACGLEAAAESGIVHRDIKPSNLLVAEDGTLKITDFGLAKQLCGNSELTQADQVIGTPNYLSPEQASGAPLDLRSDIYSLGATLYEMLTGRCPFSGPTSISIVMQHINTPAPPPRQFNAKLPYPITHVVQKMLAKKPEARPQTYQELICSLDRMVQNGAHIPMDERDAPAQTSAVLPDAPQAPRRSFAARTAGAMVVVMLLVAGFAMVKRSLTSDVVEPAVQVDFNLIDALPQPAANPAPARRALPPPATGSTAPGRSDGAEVEILTWSNERTENGDLRIYGEVINRGPVAAREINVKVTIVDSAGTVIDSTNTVVAPPQLVVEQSGTFEVRFRKPVEQAQIQLDLKWLSR